MSQTHEGAMKVLAKKAGISFEAFLSRLAVGEKWCYFCRVFHPVSKFGKDSTRYDGLTAACTESQYRTERRLKQKEGFRWCRLCATWLPYLDVLRDGLCRIHANEEYRRHYANGGSGAIRQRVSKRQRGVDAVPFYLAALLTDTFSGLCAYCDQPATTWDHIIPVSKGGDTRLGNIVPACKSCNSKKKDRPVDVMPVIGHLLINEIVMAEVV